MSDPTEQTIFTSAETTKSAENEQEDSQPQAVAPAQDDSLEDLLKEIKNERGEAKYKTLKDALIGLKNAQEYIPKVKQEKTEAEKKIEQMEAELSRLKSLEDTVFELTQKKEQASTDGVGLTEEAVAQLVERTLTAKQQQEIQKKNQQLVVQTLQQKFGAEAEKVFYAKAQELGLSAEDVNSLAARTPKAVLTLMGVTETVDHNQTKVSPTHSDINSEGFKPNQDTTIRPSGRGVMLGATSQDILEEVSEASKMADELREKGLSAYDLTNPKLYNKFILSKGK